MKYKIGDIIFAYNNGKIFKEKIKKISIDMYGVRYGLTNDASCVWHDSELFRTVDEVKGVLLEDAENKYNGRIEEINELKVEDLTGE